MKFLEKLLLWIATAKITAWKANDRDLTTATRPEESERVGSFEGSSPDGEEYKGIQVILPLPEKRIK